MPRKSNAVRAMSERVVELDDPFARLERIGPNKAVVFNTVESAAIRKLAREAEATKKAREDAEKAEVLQKQIKEGMAKAGHAPKAEPPRGHARLMNVAEIQEGLRAEKLKRQKKTPTQIIKRPEHPKPPEPKKGFFARFFGGK